MPSSPDITITIATRNRVDELDRTLTALERLSPPPLDTLLYDDASNDGTADLVASRHPRVSLTSSARQAGYIVARNHLLDAARSEYAVSLDDDAELVRPDALATIEDAFRSFPRCAVLAFRIYWGRELPPGHDAHEEPSGPVRSFVGCGHAWRLDAWRAIRPYPTWYRFYGEEAYASLALAREGWEVRYCPEVLVHHRIDPASRREGERWSRYRMQLRAGLLNILSFYPASAARRHLGHAIRVQLSKVGPGSWRRGWELARSLARIAAETPRWLRRRKPLPSSTWQQWISLPSETIFWQPADSGRARIADPGATRAEEQEVHGRG